MSITTHITSLNSKHRKLDIKLHEAYIHHLPTTEVVKIKREKLKIKDEIASLQPKVNSHKKAA